MGTVHVLTGILFNTCLCNTWHYGMSLHLSRLPAWGDRHSHYLHQYGFEFSIVNPIEEPWTIVQSITINMAEYLKIILNARKNLFGSWFRSVLMQAMSWKKKVMDKTVFLCDSQEGEEKGEKEGGALRRRYSTPVMPPPYYLFLHPSPASKSLCYHPVMPPHRDLISGGVHWLDLSSHHPIRCQWMLNPRAVASQPSGVFFTSRSF